MGRHLTTYSCAYCGKLFGAREILGHMKGCRVKNEEVTLLERYRKEREKIGDEVVGLMNILVRGR